MVLIEDYLDLQEKYQNKYGNKTIVLMQVGGFFELYGIENDNNKRGIIREISKITNLSVSKKSDKYLMAGFPLHSFTKWKDILLNEGFTIIKIEQDANGVANPERDITEIFSPGNNLETTQYSNNIMSIFIEEIKDYKTNKEILTLGLAIADINTGETYIYENHSSPDDYIFCLDEVFRFIQLYAPMEIVLTSIIETLSKEDILKYLGISHNNVHYNTYNTKDYAYMLQPKFKDEILRKVYQNTGMVDPIKYICLEKSHFALNAYIYLIQFIFEHNENNIKKLNKPVLCEPSMHLVLSLDSITQLNIIDKEKCEGISSLWDIVNKTKTCMGKRLLKYNLLNPIIDVDKLNKRYSLVEAFSNKYKGEFIYDIIGNKLKNINDIERLHRKMSIKILSPSDFYLLSASYDSIIEIIDIINILSKNSEGIESNKNGIMLEEDSIESFKELITDYKNRIVMDRIHYINNNNNIKENIFKEGIYPDIDKKQNKIEEYTSLFSQLCRILSLITSKDNKQGPREDILKLEYNDKDGHYISTTSTRSKELIKNLDKPDIFTNNQLKAISNKVDVKKLIYRQTSGKSGTTKISSDELSNLSHLLVGYQEKLKNMCIKQFTELIDNYYNTYKDTLKNISKFIAYLDFICCMSKVSRENVFVKPEIDNDTDYSYIEAKDLLHPIIAKINKNVKYVGNDVTIGHNQKGMLLYGVNAVGKSSLMKSMGIAIILAQTGFFVPAKSFKYSPYKHLFTRISNNDNMRKGQSTFEVEMSELRSILIRTNKNSLVLGDELCSGTETISGVSIVTSGVLRLVERQSSFIFATHLHQLSKMPEIINCEGVKSFHMETVFDNVTKKLIYDRKLKEGSGSSIYGLEVAKAMDLDKEFIENAYKIRNKLLDKSSKIVENRLSHFNSDIIMGYCSICKEKTEEVHHINEQHLANIDGIIDNFHKNDLFNLVQLCSKCHNKVHHENLIITGYVDTTNGIELDYKYLDSTSMENIISKKKFSGDQIDIIKDIYLKTKNISRTKKQLQTKGISISNNTIKKIVENKY